jgi:hypothetical protein
LGFRCQALFQQNWKKIGVAMEIKNMPASVVWGEYTTKSQFDTLLVGWNPTIGMDPDYTARCHSKQIPVKDGAGSNYVQYQNPEVDRLLELGVTQSEQADRKATYAKIQQILLDEVPFAPQGGSYEGDLKKKGLIGVKPNQYVTSYSWMSKSGAGRSLKCRREPAGDRPAGSRHSPARPTLASYLAPHGLALAKLAHVTVRSTNGIATRLPNVSTCPRGRASA